MSPQKLFEYFRRPQLWATGDWQLRYDKAPAHASHLVLKFFGKTSNHSGDSALLQPRFGALYCWLFPKLKSLLEGKRFQTIDEIQENTTEQLMATGRTEIQRATYTGGFLG